MTELGEGVTIPSVSAPAQSSGIAATATIPPLQINIDYPSHDDCAVAASTTGSEQTQLSLQSDTPATLPTGCSAMLNVGKGNLRILEKQGDRIREVIGPDIGNTYLITRYQFT